MNRLNASWDGLFPSFRATRRLVLLMIWYLLTFHWKSLLSNTVRLQCGKVWPTQAHLPAGISSTLVYNGICCCCHALHLVLLFRKCSFWPTTALIRKVSIMSVPVRWPHSPEKAYDAEYKVRGKGKKKVSRKGKQKTIEWLDMVHLFVCWSKYCLSYAINDHLEVWNNI